MRETTQAEVITKKKESSISSKHKSNLHVSIKQFIDFEGSSGEEEAPEPIEDTKRKEITHHV